MPIGSATVIKKRMTVNIKKNIHTYVKLNAIIYYFIFFTWIYLIALKKQL